jgi:hypothetical protein
MNMPDRFIVVDRVFVESGPFDLTTHDGCGRFIEAVVRLLHQEDPNWGHLRKSAPHNMYNGHAVDSVMYRAAGQSCDIVAFSETKDAHPAWQPDIPRYSDADWYAPEDVDPPVVVIPPPPPPPPVDPPVTPPDTIPVPTDELLGLFTQLAARLDAIDKKLAEPAPIYDTSVFGQHVTLTPRRP